MDLDRAMQEARRRWGQAGSLSIADEFTRSNHLVGVLLPGPHFVVHGRGSSWDAAFADADARAEGASRRRADSGAPLRIAR